MTSPTRDVFQLELEKRNVVQAEIDPLTGGIANLTAGGRSVVSDLGLVVSQPLSVDRPYLMAGFGDSRSVSLSANNNTSGIWSTMNADTGTIGLDNNSVMPHIASLFGDAEPYMEFGVAGETTSSWNSATRGGSAGQQKAIGYLTASKVDIVYFQYGINSVLTSYTGANYAGVMETIVGQLKAAFVEIIKSGKFVIYDSVWPFWVNGGTYPATALYSAEKLQMVYDINATMKAFVAQFPTSSVYVDTASFIADPVTGYAKSSILNDGLHPILENNARAIAAHIVSKVRYLFPVKRSTWFARNAGIGNQSYPNLIDLIAPSTFHADDGGGGSSTGRAYSTGIDNGEFYHQLVWTPSSLSSGIQRVRFEIHANVGSQNGTPFYKVSAGDLIQGSCNVMVDDGNGGPSVATLVNVRSRVSYYSGTPANTWAETAGGPIQTLTLDQSYRKFTTPTFTVGSTGAADITQPAVTKGMRLEIFVSTPTLGQQIRLRVKSPMLRKVG